jgi:multidrug resistance efflux pump
MILIRSTTEGPVGYCPYVEGDRVQAGEILIKIDRPVYEQEALLSESELKVALARLADLKAGSRPEEIAQAKELVEQKRQAADFAESDYNRIKKLVDSGALPGEDAEKARVEYVRCRTNLSAARERLAMLKKGPTSTEIQIQQAMVDQTRAKLELARARLDECIIRAPFDGVVNRVLIRKGDLAVPRISMIELYDRNSLVIRFAVPESESAMIKNGMKVSVELDAYPEQKFAGIVNKVFPDLIKDSRSRLVQARVVESPDLMPGMFARVSADLQVKNCLTIPDKAILSTVRGEKVAYVYQDGKVSLRKLKIGMENGNRVHILSGIKEGDLVVVEGNRSIKDQAQVKILKSSDSGGAQGVQG